MDKLVKVGMAFCVGIGLFSGVMQATDARFSASVVPELTIEDVIGGRSEAREIARPIGRALGIVMRIIPFSGSVTRGQIGDGLRGLNWCFENYKGVVSYIEACSSQAEEIRAYEVDILGQDAVNAASLESTQMIFAYTVETLLTKYNAMDEAEPYVSHDEIVVFEAAWREYGAVHPESMNYEAEVARMRFEELRALIEQARLATQE